MIRGGAEYALGIYITGVDQGSAAECGGIKVPRLSFTCCLSFWSDIKYQTSFIRMYSLLYVLCWCACRGMHSIPVHSILSLFFFQHWGISPSYSSHCTYRMYQYRNVCQNDHTAIFFCFTVLPLDWTLNPVNNITVESCHFKVSRRNRMNGIRPCEMRQGEQWTTFQMSVMGCEDGVLLRAIIKSPLLLFSIMIPAKVIDGLFRIG